jgi:hypothetical protein
MYDYDCKIGSEGDSRSTQCSPGTEQLFPFNTEPRANIRGVPNGAADLECS